MFFRTSQKDQDTEIENLKTEVRFNRQSLELQREILNKIPLLEERIKSLESQKERQRDRLILLREDFSKLLDALRLTITPGRVILTK